MSSSEKPSLSHLAFENPPRAAGLLLCCCLSICPRACQAATLSSPAGVRTEPLWPDAEHRAGAGNGRKQRGGVTWHRFGPLLLCNHPQTSRCKRAFCHAHRVCGSGLQTGHGRESVALAGNTHGLGDSTAGPGIIQRHLLSRGWCGGWLPMGLCWGCPPERLCMTSPLTVRWPRRVDFLHGRSGMGGRVYPLMT